MSSNRDRIRNHVLNVLERAGTGLRVDDVYERLEETYDLTASQRTVQETLREMVNDAQIDRQRRNDGSPGRPPYYYFLRETDDTRRAPVSYTDDKGQQATLLSYQPGVEKATVRARGDMEPVMSEEEEDEESLDDYVTEIGREALAEIAHTHKDQSAYVQRITRVAPELEQENPVDLLVEMVHWTVDNLNELGAEVRELHPQISGDIPEFQDRLKELESFRGWARRYFQGFWRLDPRGREEEAKLDIPRTKDFYDVDEPAQAAINLDDDELRSHFQKRVIGENVVEVLPIEENVRTGVGTDSSVADIQVRNEQAFVPQTELSVFTAAAALETDEGQYTDFDFTPQRYEAYNDAEALERGLVLSTQTRHDLSEGQLDHARPAALDLRQYHENIRVSMGDARWRPSGETTQPLVGIPRADLVFGDGRVFPLVHHVNDFRQDNAYGRLVRNEIRRFFEQTKRAEDQDLGGIFAGAVKHPHRVYLAPLVFWYIHVKSDLADREGSNEEIPAEVYKHRLPDEIVSHLLFIGYEENGDAVNDDEMFVTCRVLRCFSDIALNSEAYPPTLDESGRRIDERDVDEWMKYFDEERTRLEDRFGKRPLPRGEYHPFAYLCANSAVLMCYGAPCSLYLGQHDATMTLPRIEVSTPTGGPNDADVRTTMSWFSTHHTGDMDHMRGDFSSVGEMPVLVPRVVEQAHEAATFVRKRMNQEVENELRKFIADLQ